MEKIKGIVGYSVGILLSILTFAWYALAGATATVKSSYLGQTVKTSSSTSVYDMMKELDAMEGLGKASTVMAIIALVLAALAAIACVLGLLNNLGILKFDAIKYVVYAVVGLLVLVTFLAMLFMVIYGADNSISDTGFGSMTLTSGVGLILAFVFSVLALASTVIANVKFKK